MNLTRKFTAAVAAFVITAAAAVAAVSVAGTWKWTQQGRQGGQGTERALMLKVDGGTVTGTLKGFSMGQFEVPDTAIGDAKLAGNKLTFTVTTEFNGNKRVSKYEATPATNSPARSSPPAATAPCRSATGWPRARSKLLQFLL